MRSSIGVMNTESVTTPPPFVELSQRVTKCGGEITKVPFAKKFAKTEKTPQNTARTKFSKTEKRL